MKIIANKLAKFHAKRLNRSENIPKSFRANYFFLKHQVVVWKMISVNTAVFI